MPEKRGAAARLPRWTVPAGIAALVTVLVVVLLAIVPGHGDDSAPRGLTEDEANRLAITRFRNYEAHGRAVRITVPGPAGDLVVTGTVDYRGKLGYGVVRAHGRGAGGDGLIEWSADTVLLLPLARVPARAPQPPPAMGWYHRPLRTAGSTLDSALTIALGLGSDRPDNAQLLPQNGARWIAADQVAGHRVDVMAGPQARDLPASTGSVRYWLGGDGTMYRVRATVSSESRPVLIELGARIAAALRPVPGLVPH